MATSPKTFAIPAAKIRRLVPGSFGCFASDMIAVQGNRVGYMYRQAPNQQWDSGWVFIAGNELHEFMDDAGNHGIYNNLNTIANYDPEIIPLLNSPPGSAFERKNGTGPLVAAPPPPLE